MAFKLIRPTQAGSHVCCCGWKNLDDKLFLGEIECKNEYHNSFYSVVRLIDVFRCRPIESNDFSRYVYNIVYIRNCVVDFANVRFMRNIKHLEASNSQILNAQSIKKLHEIDVINFSRNNNNIKKVFNLNGMAVKSLDLSHNEIEAVDDLNGFSERIEYLYLNDNKIRYFNHKLLIKLHFLVELHLQNNLLRQIQFELNLLEGLELRTEIFLNGNTQLRNFTGFCILYFGFLLVNNLLTDTVSVVKNHFFVKKILFFLNFCKSKFEQ